MNPITVKVLIKLKGHTSHPGPPEIEEVTHVVITALREYGYWLVSADIQADEAAVMMDTEEGVYGKQE